MHLFLPLIASLTLQSPAPRPTASPLRKVDWANRSYGPHMHLRNGRYAYRRYPARHHPMARRCRHTSQTARLFRVRYRDLTGDAAPEAIVEIQTYKNMCRGYAFKRRAIIVFTRRAGRVVELGSFHPLNVRSVRLHKRAIHVERLERRKQATLRCKDVWRRRGAQFEITRSKCVPVP